jgi:predicted DCC family thiol-disulfide oxidoreductase YuxK
LAGKSKGQKIRVYYDGKCSMCRSIADAVRTSSRTDQFELFDMHTTNSLPFAKADIEKEIHVTSPDGGIHKGPDAILKMAEQYPHLRVTARIARSPMVWFLAPSVYRFIAANRRFLTGPASRLYGLKLAIMIAFCTGLAMSPHLWTGPRSFPTAPIFGLTFTLNHILADFLYIALFLLSAMAIASSKPQKYFAAFLSIIAVFCALDQIRWQPWVFQYSFLIGALALFSWRADDAVGLQRTLNIARLIVATTYIYSGLQKANLNFLKNEFPWIVQPITNVLPSASSALQVFATVVPFLQIAFGLGLLTNRFRRPSLLLAISMHVFILAMFGPLGQNWNSIIWPWTAVMAVFDVLLFGGKFKSSMRDAFWPGRNYYHAAMIVLFGILPMTSFLNLWDSYLSSALYSGNVADAQIYTSDAGRAALPAAIGRYLVHTSPNTNVLNMQRWAIEDLNVTPYPEPRVYKSVTRTICGEMVVSAQLALVVHEQRLFFNDPESSYSCSDL